jgi:hypothetical protein
MNENKKYGRKGNYRGNMISKKNAKKLKRDFRRQFVGKGTRKTKVVAKAYSKELILKLLGCDCKCKCEGAGLRIYFGYAENKGKIKRKTRGAWELHPVLTGYKLTKKKFSKKEVRAFPSLEGQYKTKDF